MSFSQTRESLYCRPPGFTVVSPGKHLAGGLQSGRAANFTGAQYSKLRLYNRASDKSIFVGELSKMKIGNFMEEKNMDLMNELLKSLNSIDCNIFDEDYLNELLDSRDSDPFDTEWCRVNEEIETLKNTQSYTDKNEEEQGKIREKAFMKIEENIGGELSEYVSDDFGLIYDSLVLNYDDEWLNKLITAYRNKKIPAGEL